MRIACLCLLVFGCAHRSADAAPAGTPDASPTSAFEAASDGGGTDETSGCSSDADCSTTRVEVGGCCPMLCTPRVVTRERALALEENVASCSKGRQCSQPLCRPPLETILPACLQNRCVPKRGGPAY